MGCQKIKTIGWIVFEIIDGLAGSESSWDLNSADVNEIRYKLYMGKDDQSEIELFE